MNVDYDDRSGARWILPKTCILCVNEFMNMGGVLGYCGISGFHHILNNCWFKVDEKCIFLVFFLNTKYHENMQVVGSNSEMY